MAKSNEEKRAETERKLEIAVTFLQEVIASRMAAGTWGKVTIVAIVEGGYIKEVALDDHTVVRDIPTVKLKNPPPPIDKN